MKDIPIDLRKLVFKAFCIGLFSAGFLILLNDIFAIVWGNNVWTLIIKIIFWIALAIGDGYLLLHSMRNFLIENHIHLNFDLRFNHSGPGHTHTLSEPLMEDIIRFSKKLNGIEKKGEQK